jgi:protein-tyrosine phosphatase
MAVAEIAGEDKMHQTTSVATSKILLLCSANQCRSPMAGALLTRWLAPTPQRVAVVAAVRSAGLLDEGLLQEGAPPPPEAVSALASYGLDISEHRSHRVTAADLSGAELVLGMSRAHVRHAVVIAPEIWPRAFTLKELLRRGTETGPRRPGEPVADWLARVHEGRERAALLGDSPADDVADPIGGPPQAYTNTAALLNELMGRLAGLCWGLPADRLPADRLPGEG